MVVGDFATDVDTLVIGSGPGGYVAAIRAAQLGQKVTIVEKEKIGGVCLNVGCIPSKALIEAGHRFQQVQSSANIGIAATDVTLDFPKVQQWKDSVVTKLTNGVEGLLKGNNIEVIKGEAYFASSNSVRIMDEKNAQTYNFKHCIIATGSRPIELPHFKWSKRLINSTGALALTELPKKLIVVGGGYIGIELSSAYASFGTEVVVLEGGKQILPSFEKQMSELVYRRMNKNGVTIHTEAIAQQVEETDTEVKVTAEIKGEVKTFTADYVLVTVGRKPNTDELGLEQIGVALDDRGLINVDKQCKTSVEGIYAIGDIVAGPMLAHKASYEAKVAAEAISGQPSEVDYIAIPEVIYSSPELAAVGLNEAEAKEQGYDVVVGKFPFAANGRALTMDETDGFVKMVIRKDDNVVLGVQIAGKNASELIAEAALAIEAGMSAEDVALTIHPHPTLAEAMMETADVVLGKPIHVLK